MYSPKKCSPHPSAPSSHPPSPLGKAKESATHFKEDPNATRCPTGSTSLRSAQDDGVIKPPSGREGDRGGRFPNVNVMSVWGSPVVVEGARRE